MSNLDDLIAGIDPAPMLNPIDVSPQTISFESGERLVDLLALLLFWKIMAMKLVRLDLPSAWHPGLPLRLWSRFEIGSEAPTDSYSFDLVSR